MDAGLEAQQRDAVRSSVRREVIDQQLTILAATELGPDIHALQLAILAAFYFDAYERLFLVMDMLVLLRFVLVYDSVLALSFVFVCCIY